MITNLTRFHFRCTPLFSLLLLVSVFSLITNNQLHANEIRLDDAYQWSIPETPPCSPHPQGLLLRPTIYSEFDAAEWQARTGSLANNAPITFEDFHSADFLIHFPSSARLTLHWSKGSHADATDFQPFTRTLADSDTISLESFGGRSSDGAMPFFNIAHGDDRPDQQGGMIMAIGWSGNWRATFSRQPDGSLRVQAGLQHTRFQVPSGESLKLPSILLMSYQGRAIDGQNKFRRLMLSHYRPDDRTPLQFMPVAASVHGMLAFNATNQSNLLELSDHIVSLQLPLDTFWLDAGWNAGGFPAGQGNPDPDTDRFPSGLRELGTAIARSQLQFLLWFEPERAMRGTWLDQHHSDWLLRPSNTPDALRYMENDGFYVLDMGNPTARQWAVDTVSKQITEYQVKIYRQDFNAYPSFFWHTNKPQDEACLHELRYINGLYSFLDTLRERHPGLIIDNCASGGRRIDIEMMRRSVCLWRSDSCWDSANYPRNVQAMTYGLSLWLPLHGLGSVSTDPVSLRSGMGACSSFAINYRDPQTVNNLRAHLEKYLAVRHLFYADFYPLTPWSSDAATTLAFQFHDPVTESGLVQSFCSPANSQQQLALQLQGLHPEAQYQIHSWDEPEKAKIATGAELASLGLTPPANHTAIQASVWQYRRVGN